MSQQQLPTFVIPAALRERVLEHFKAQPLGDVMPMFEALRDAFVMPPGVGFARDEDGWRIIVPNREGGPITIAMDRDGFFTVPRPGNGAAEGASDASAQA